MAVLIALITLAHYSLRLNAVLAFWPAYILTPAPRRLHRRRHVPAHKAGGLCLGTTGTSVIFLVVIVALVVFLAVTKVDQTERAEARHELEPLDDPEDDGVRV